MLSLKCSLCSGENDPSFLSIKSGVAWGCLVAIVIVFTHLAEEI